MACVYRIKGDSRIFKSKEELYSYFENEYSKGIKFNGIVPEEKTENGRPTFAWYDPATRAISISQRWVEEYKKNPTSATLLLVHEILHALKTTRTVEQQSELEKNLTEFRNSLLATEEFKALKSKENKTDIDNKILAILNMSDIEEIMTYGLTDVDFAKWLDTIKTEVNGKTSTFWAKLKEIIRQLAQSLGIGTKLDELNYIFDAFISGEEAKLVNLERSKQVEDLSNEDAFP